MRFDERHEPQYELQTSRRQHENRAGDGLQARDLHRARAENQLTASRIVMSQQLGELSSYGAGQGNQFAAGPERKSITRYNRREVRNRDFVNLSSPAIFVYHLYEHQSGSDHGEFVIADDDEVLYAVVLACEDFQREALFLVYICYQRLKFQRHVSLLPSLGFQQQRQLGLTLVMETLYKFARLRL